MMCEEKKSTPVAFKVKLICSIGFIFLASGNASARTLFTGAYDYKLEMSKDDKVCRHMEKVYKKHFRTPWRVSSFPVDLVNEDDRARNMFPRLPGLEFDAAMAKQMLFSRFPSSPEFEVIQWREGRYKSMSDEKTYPVLVADFDIDNDGKIDTVIHDSFFSYANDMPSKFYPSGIDGFGVYPTGTLNLKAFEGNWLAEFNPNNQTARAVDRLRQTASDAMWLSLRPFVWDGVTYLSASSYMPGNADIDRGHTHKDYTEVLKYIRGSRERESSDEPPLELETICRFRMFEVHQPSNKPKVPESISF